VIEMRGLSLQKDDWDNNNLRNIQDTLDSDTTKQCDVYDVCDEGHNIIEKINNDDQNGNTITNNENDGDDPNTPILSRHQKIIDQSNLDDDSSTVTNLE